MNRKLIIALISSIVAANSVWADFAFSEASDYTGDAFFTPPVQEETHQEKKKASKNGETIPPIKLLRLKLKQKFSEKENNKFELAPTAADLYTGEIETSEYASKELKDDFEDINPDGFEADEDSELENPKTKKSFFRKKDKAIEEADTEDIILDCDNVDYDTPNYLILASGNVSVEFVKQSTTVKADTITFDRINNTIKAEGNVRILKNGQTVTGDYIFVDMNEENALIENPLTRTATIEIKAQKGYVYGDKIVQEKGSIEVKDSYPINFHSATRGPKIHKMLVPKNASIEEDIENGIFKLKAKDIKITQKGDLEIISLKQPRIFKGEKTIFKVPAVKLYTNKNHDYVETNIWEIGSYRGLGIYSGPGFVFELPKGSVLKAMPILNYKSGFGIGGYGRFSSGTNQTMAAYGTATSKFIVYGKQELDDHLYLQYGMNSYFDEWFLGRRRPKYGASLVYDKSYSSNSFLIKDQRSHFRHRFDAGYYQDLDYDNHFERLQGTDMGTTRFRYMAEAGQNLYSYKNPEELKAFEFGVNTQLSSAIYGNGDTQVIGRIGPRLHTQYKRWMQDIGYYFSVYDDNTPMPVFDAYRYGKQNLYLREYFRLSRYLTVSWFSSINLTNDAANGRDFQENSFYFSVGPDDMKFNVGYDFVRQNLYCTVEMMMDAKGANVEYDTLEIKQDKKAKKSNEPKENNFEAAKPQKTLQRAVVEDVKIMEEVL